jgi:hypothetical protein
MSKKANAPAERAEADAARDGVRTASLAHNDSTEQAARQVQVCKVGPGRPSQAPRLAHRRRTGGVGPVEGGRA